MFVLHGVRSISSYYRKSVFLQKLGSGDEFYFTDAEIDGIGETTLE